MVSSTQPVLASLVLLSLAPAFAGGNNDSPPPAKTPTGVTAVTPNKFRVDDPLWIEPKPLAVRSVAVVDINKLYDFVDGSFVVPRRGKKIRRGGAATAQNVNTLGEVPDSDWYTNRHARRRMSLKDLVRGAGGVLPAADGKWEIISAKTDGVTPGFRIRDKVGNTFMIKLDPPDYPELGSAPEAIGSRIFYALGYNTTDNNIVHFRREQLVVSEGATWRDSAGHNRTLTVNQTDRLLAGQPKDSEGSYRAVASRWIAGKIVGPFTFEGTRSDDPNDIVPHEYRRELRGLALFEAWLNNTDARAYNTLDSLSDDGGTPHLIHYIIDWGSALGSNAVGPKDIRQGHEYVIDPKITGINAVTFGFYLPLWMRVHYPSIRGVGKFDWRSFDAKNWRASYPVGPFLLMDDEDAFWAAKKVMAFSDAEIQAIVATGQYTDPRATEWVSECLVKRRDKIGQAWLSRGLALDNFRLQDGRLLFDDLAEKYKISPARQYKVQWSVFDNATGERHPVESSSGTWTAPVAAGEQTGFLAARIRAAADEAEQEPSEVTVYLRRSGDGWGAVGIDRRYE